MRHVFNSLGKLAGFLLGQRGGSSRQVAFSVEIDGNTSYTFAGNTDQAIAAVVRSTSNVIVRTVPIRDLVQAASPEAGEVVP